MIIHIEGFNHKNEYFSQDIHIHNTSIYMLTEWSDYDWFLDGNELDRMLSKLSEDTTYTLLYNKIKYILLRIVLRTTIIISPLVSSNIKIRELKDILAIKDNIYFHNIKMNENKTLKYYNINNMDTLVYAVRTPVTLDC